MLATRIRCLSLLTALVLMGACAPSRRPVIVLPDEAAGHALHVIDLCLDERVYWRLHDGSEGRGYFQGLAGDTLLVATHRAKGPSVPRRVLRLPVAKLDELQHWDARGEPYIYSAALGLLVLGVGAVAVMGIALSKALGG